MTIEGVVGLAAGVEADSLSLMIWAASSFVEGLASVTILDPIAAVVISAIAIKECVGLWRGQDVCCC